MTRWYMLDENKQVVPAPMGDNGLPTLEFFQWFESREGKIVKQDTVNGHWISTVFLGMDHRFTTDVGPPIVFETMIFPSEDNLVECNCWRYCTYDEALFGHELACEVALKYGSGIPQADLEKAASVIQGLLDK